MSQENQFALDLGEEKKLQQKRKIIKNIIIDRKSKYTVVGIYLEDTADVKKEMRSILVDKYFQKATHNSYAYRVKKGNGIIEEGKNDDGETGAGMCILRELRRENYVNALVVVTRYFGGIHLNADRFKNVIEGCQKFFDGEEVL